MVLWCEAVCGDTAFACTDQHRCGVEAETGLKRPWVAGLSFTVGNAFLLNVSTLLPIKPSWPYRHATTDPQYATLVAGYE